MRAVASRLGRKEGRLSKSQLAEQLGSSAFTRSHAHPFIYRCLPKTAGQGVNVPLQAGPQNLKYKIFVNYLYCILNIVEK